ncbi:MAG: MxcH [Gallionellaceae bacterium]|nr:MAG: MxcH [Gallionellaceae bacterium]
MHIPAHIPPYSSIGDISIRQIAAAFLLALLLHALVLLAFYWTPTKTQLAHRQTLEVSLESSAPSSSQEPDKRPPPKPQPVPVEAPATQPTQTVPSPAEAPPQPATPSAASAHNSTPVAEEIQPLFRLTRMPGFQQKVEADYPAQERRAGIQANVLAEVTINAQGNVLNVRIIKSGGAAFDDAVKQALQKSTFTPGMIDNKPVGTRFQVPFRFNLN